MELPYALSQSQRSLRDTVCRRRTTRDGRLHMLDRLERDPWVNRADVEVVRRWLRAVHGPRRGAK
jgi:hypothetical protein